jgi:dUTP pyrophosphatase
MPATLQVHTTDSSIRALYTQGCDTGQNSGFDLCLPSEFTFPPHKTVWVNFLITARNLTDMHEPSGFWLLPRSSISKTPLRMANSIGLIDADYRGCLIAALENTGDTAYTAPKGARLVQVAQADLKPFRVEWTEVQHSPTLRGMSGFGSSGFV